MANAKWEDGHKGKSGDTETASVKVEGGVPDTAPSPWSSPRGRGASALGEIKWDILGHFGALSGESALQT